MRISAKLEFNGFDSIPVNVENRVSLVVRKTAFDIEAGAKSRAAVDTGMLRSSIYVITYSESTYPAAVEQALAIFKAAHAGKGKVTKPPELLEEEPKPTNKLTALVAVAANYGWFIENGTSKQAAQPFFLQAVITATNPFLTAVAAAVAAGVQDSSK